MMSLVANMTHTDARRLLHGLAAYVVMVLALLAVHHGTAGSMAAIWAGSDTYAHAFLVPPISLWLMWRSRDRVQVLAPRAAPIWVLPFLLAGLVWLLGVVLAVNALAHFALVTMVVLLAPAVLGPAIARVWAFPLLFLYFSVPFGDFLLPWAMEATADFTIAALRLTGIPVYREGLHFIIPSGNWSVVEACSGVRYLIASTMVGSLFAYLNYQALWRRLVFVGVAFIVPIVANWLRAYMIVMIGHLSDNRLATGVDHILYGWVFFGVVITIMFVIGARWAEPPLAVEQGRARSAEDAGQGSYLGARTWVTVGWLCAATALPMLALDLMQARVAQAPVVLEWPAASAQAWPASGGEPAWKPQFSGASLVRQSLHRDGSRSVAAYLAYYRAQGPGHKLVTSSNVLVTAEDTLWIPVKTSDVEQLIDGGRVHWRVTHLVGRLGGVASARRHLTVWQTYWVDDQFTPNQVRAKALGAQSLLVGRGDDGAAIVLHSELPPSEGGNAAIEAFAKAAMPAIRASLQRAQQLGQAAQQGR